MIPLSDSPRDPNHVPWATLGLMFANVLAAAFTFPFALQDWPAGMATPGGWPEEYFNGFDALVVMLGFRPAAPALWSAGVAMFLHAGWLHLLGNLLYLWIYGPNVENRLGRVGFLLLYFTAGLLGSVLYALTSLGSEIPMIGASGAIAGLLGAYLVFFPFHAIRMWFGFFTVRLPAFVVLLAFLVVDNVLPFLLDSHTTTAHAAHLGGFFAGGVLAFGLVWLQPAPKARRERRTSSLARARALAAQGMLIDARALLLHEAEGDDAAAARDLLAEIESNPAFQRSFARSRG
jgi:membrane associated rhomboid family serine protease